MKKTVLTLFTFIALFLFIDDAKAITCDYQLKIGDQEITVSTTEKLKKENCEANRCEIAHDYKFQYNGKTTSNGSASINIGGKNYTLEFKEFSPPKQFKDEAIKYMENTSRTCQALYSSIDKNGTKYTISSSGKNKLTTITKPSSGSSSSKPSGGSNNGGNTSTKPSGPNNPLDGDCETWLGSETVELLKQIFGLIQIAAPILVIILTMVDFVGVVISSEDGAMKKAWGKFVKRAVVAIALILLPILVNFALDMGGVGSGTCGIE